MKILKAQIDLNWNCDVEPSLIITVDRIPKLGELLFIEKHPFYFAEKDGYVCFFYQSPNDQRGYGGRNFDINTNFGPRTLRGPYSSRPAVMNTIEGFKTSKDCIILTKKNNYASSGRITIDLYKKILKDNPNLDFELIREREDSYFKYTLTKKGMSPEQFIAWKRVYLTIQRYHRILEENRLNENYYPDEKITNREKFKEIFEDTHELVNTQELYKFGILVPKID